MNMISKQELLEKVAGGEIVGNIECREKAHAKYVECFNTAQATLTGPDLYYAVMQCREQREIDMKACSDV